ncbi:PREDICTED: uncharacterized protein C5orf49 homolog, partial [Tinamus guttatus]|uniref:uncharacterized protein C5orf49 homolog n=1 Tax=Tinamus guttatus TaxID=94827 RepID=UPI00052EDC90
MHYNDIIILFEILKSALKCPLVWDKRALWLTGAPDEISTVCNDGLGLGLTKERTGAIFKAGESRKFSSNGEERLAAPAGRKHWLPLSAQSAFSYIPPGRQDAPELSYFHREAKAGSVSTYDSIFKRPEGYNKYLHRCDREHAKNQGLNINDE